jgi:protein-disulfide isomerase
VKGGAKRPDDKRGFYIALAVLAIAGIGTLSWLRTRARATTSYVDSTIAPIANQGHVIGSDSAPVEIVEFADFECPACATFANLTEPDIRARLVNTGQARFRFIDFPLDMHRNTWAAHLAAWCAGDQGRFWEMHDAIFMNQDRWSGEATRNPEGVLAPLAQQVGLNMEQYESCMDSRKFIPQIRANYDEAIRRSIQSTPSFQIGNQVHLGTRSFDEFRSLVAKEIAAKQPAPATKR